MIPGVGASPFSPAYSPSPAQVVDQVLAVDDETKVVDEVCSPQRLLGEQAVLLVVVGDQDRERLALKRGMTLSSLGVWGMRCRARVPAPDRAAG